MMSRECFYRYQDRKVSNLDKQTQRKSWRFDNRQLVKSYTYETINETRRVDEIFNDSLLTFNGSDDDDNNIGQQFPVPERFRSSSTDSQQTSEVVSSCPRAARRSRSTSSMEAAAVVNSFSNRARCDPVTCAALEYGLWWQNRAGPEILSENASFVVNRGSGGCSFVTYRSPLVINSPPESCKAILAPAPDRDSTDKEPPIAQEPVQSVVGTSDYDGDEEVTSAAKWKSRCIHKTKLIPEDCGNGRTSPEKFRNTSHLQVNSNDASGYDADVQSPTSDDCCTLGYIPTKVYYSASNPPECRVKTYAEVVASSGTTKTTPRDHSTTIPRKCSGSVSSASRETSDPPEKWDDNGSELVPKDIRRFFWNESELSLVGVVSDSSCTRSSSDPVIGSLCLKTLFSVPSDTIDLNQVSESSNDLRITGRLLDSNHYGGCSCISNGSRPLTVLPDVIPSDNKLVTSSEPKSFPGAWRGNEISTDDSRRKSELAIVIGASPTHSRHDDVSVLKRCKAMIFEPERQEETKSNSCRFQKPKPVLGEKHPARGEKRDMVDSKSDLEAEANRSSSRKSLEPGELEETAAMAASENPHPPKKKKKRPRKKRNRKRMLKVRNPPQPEEDSGFQRNPTDVTSSSEPIVADDAHDDGRYGFVEHSSSGSGKEGNEISEHPDQAKAADLLPESLRTIANAAISHYCIICGSIFESDSQLETGGETSVGEEPLSELLARSIDKYGVDRSSSSSSSEDDSVDWKSSSHCSSCRQRHENGCGNSDATETLASSSSSSSCKEDSSEQLDGVGVSLPEAVKHPYSLYLAAAVAVVAQVIILCFVPDGIGKL